MGKDLYASSAAAKALFDEADNVLGWSISEICFEGPADKLTESKYCQPAIYTMSCAALATFREKFPEIEPVACGGLSLGEYAALYAAGAFSFADGLKLIARRGELMDDACRENEGGMASVLGGDAEIIREVCEECGIQVANYNSPGQIVISGQKDKVGIAVAALKERGMRKVIPLNVAGAFHSKLMASAGERLAEVLNATPMEKPAIPVYHNFTAASAADVNELRFNLREQVAGSVRWEECVRGMIAAGGDTMVEFGPGNVLTGLLRRTDKTIKFFNINSTESLNEFSV
jgi:[acyl-carrier-protein] S-malonyltransferase